MGNSVMLNGVEYAGEQIAYKDSTYELVSKVAYLIGVPLRIFQNEHEPPKIEIYNRLEQDKNARIIRNLCIIRTAIERNYRKMCIRDREYIQSQQESLSERIDDIESDISSIRSDISDLESRMLSLIHI